MSEKPIDPATHGALDYGLTALQLLAPTLFGLKGVARLLCYGFAANTGIVNSLSDHPLGLKKLIPFRLHGQLEVPLLPILLALPWALGAFKQRNARFYFVGFFVVALTNFLLTDFNAYESAKKTG